MYLYRVELKSTDNWEDYGSSCMEICAKNDKEAYKKACALEEKENISKIVCIRSLY